MSQDSSGSNSSGSISRRAFVARTFAVAAVVAIPTAVTALPAQAASSGPTAKGDEPGASRHPDRSPLPAPPPVSASSQPASRSSAPVAPVTSPSRSPIFNTAPAASSTVRSRGSQTGSTTVPDPERKKRGYDFF